MTDEDLRDLRERLEAAKRRVDHLANSCRHTPIEEARLRGKAEGLGVALNYLRGYGR